jgi:hypothetical protein
VGIDLLAVLIDLCGGGSCLTGLLELNLGFLGLARQERPACCRGHLATGGSNSPAAAAAAAVDDGGYFVARPRAKLSSAAGATVYSIQS